MYEVICFFTDLQDFGYPYNVGDMFPRDGLKVSDERIQELCGSNNKQGKPLIRKKEEPEFQDSDAFSQEDFNDEDEIQEDDSLKNSYTKTGINRMSTAQLQALAAKSGIENASQISGSELKKILIERFKL